MASNKQVIRIENILGGQSIYAFDAEPNQYYEAYNINPDNTYIANRNIGVGGSVLAPMFIKHITSTTFTGVPIWMQGAPRGNEDVFIYDAKGSVYSLHIDTTSYVTELGDLNDAGSAYGNGMAYYDNYMYFARATTVARYGPLSGTASFTKDYWVTTLGKSRLKDQPSEYRNSSFTNVTYPNHVMHRHTNGVLYIADVVAGQGVIHAIKTTKTTVEGDTDNGSTYGALYLPYGYIISDIASLNDDLVIACYEGDANSPEGQLNYNRVFEGRASLFFWDTTSSTYYKKIQEEFPDQYISALANANGVLYTFSCSFGKREPTGLRVMRYLGGNSFEQICLLASEDTPLPGGVATKLNQIVFTSTKFNGSLTEGGSAVWSIGSQNLPLSNSVFCICGARSSTGAGHSLVLSDNGAPWSDEIYYAYSNNDNSATLESFGGNVDSFDTDLRSGRANAFWYSNWYKIGTRFKITKIKIFNIDININSGTDIRILVGVDHTEPSEKFSINSANYPSYASYGGDIILKPNNLFGRHSFQIAIKWLGTYVNPVSLPIEIEYELYDD